MSDRSEAGTLGLRLQSRRRRTFVGRASEVELFEAALDTDPPPFAVLYLHGPGGVGKTALVEVLAERAAKRDAVVVPLDGREVLPSPDAVLAALSNAGLGVPADAASAGGPGRPIGVPGGRRLVLLFDAYERLAPLDGWVRGGLLPRMPADTVTVLAGRSAPADGWRADPGWRELCRVVSLRNLGPDDGDAYLARVGVAAHHRPGLLAASHGHPLALALLADLVLRGHDVEGDPLDPDLVGVLLRRFLDVVPSPVHRRALEVCALARVGTEGLLRDALEVDDAREPFEWLRGLSFMEVTGEGLMPHDLARDVLDTDLRWRDPEMYRSTFRSVRDHIHRRLATLDGLEQQRAIFDEKFVFRNLPSVLSPLDWDAWGESHPEPARAADRAAVLDLVDRAEGPSSAAIAERWWNDQPGAFHVVRGDGGTVRGMIALVQLTSGRGPASPVDGDPGARAAWEHAHRTAPPRPGEVVSQTRFVIDRERYQAPSPTLNAVPILAMQHYLRTPNLAWGSVTLSDPDPLDDYFALADLPRAEGADFTVAGRTFGLFAHDFRRVPVDQWLEVVTERALAQDVAPPRTNAAEVLVLSQAAFADAVKQALRDLTRPDLLVRNPLRRARLVMDRAGDDDPSTAAAVLDGLVRDAVGSLRDHPRDQRRWRALERTYLHPAASQERAAEAVGVPFSTYRRHLTEGVARVVDLLWHQELYGHADPHVTRR